MSIKTITVNRGNKKSVTGLSFTFFFSLFNKRKKTKEKRAEDFPLLFGCVHIVETVIAIITDAVNTPEISAAETISHLFDAIKRFIKNLRSAFYSVF